jgi:hypothetical protein
MERMESTVAQILTMTRNNAKALGLQLQMYRKEVLDSASLTRWSQASDDDFSKLLRDLKVYLDKEMFLQNVRRVLGSLHFDQIRMRHSDVKHAHRNSYEWILSGDQRRDMPSFPAWLRSGHGMFWITGKAGSGKSTLVKFLCNQPRQGYCWQNGRHLKSVSLGVTSSGISRPASRSLKKACCAQSYSRSGTNALSSSLIPYWSQKGHITDILAPGLCQSFCSVCWMLVDRRTSRRNSAFLSMVSMSMMETTRR